MNLAWILLSTAPVLTAPVQSASPEPQRLERVPNEERFDARAWRERLGARDLDARERDYDQIVQRARRDPEARRALEEWSRDAGAPELAWTARLALREAGRPGASDRGDAAWDLRQRFRDLDRRFGGLDSMFDDLQRDFDRMFQAPPAPAPGARAQSRSYSMQVGPDGVKVEVQEDVDGQSKTRTYTGRTLDEILEAHPELRDTIQAGPQVDLFGARPGPGLGLTPRDRLQGFDPFSGSARPLQPGKVRTDVLGVLCTKPSDDERKRSSVDAGVGLKVERSEPGTIAAALGLQSGDILVTVNGRTIHEREDVAAALRERKAGEDVRVEVVDAKGQRHTLTWKEPMQG
jgi:hypothetical protein